MRKYGTLTFESIVNLRRKRNIFLYMPLLCEVKKYWCKYQCVFLSFFVQGRKEKSKYGYVVRKNLDFDKAELLLYEPVEKMPPYSRKTLVFVSPPGIPKQPLVHKLVDSNNDKFARPIPCK